MKGRTIRRKAVLGAAGLLLLAGVAYAIDFGQLDDFENGIQAWSGAPDPYGPSVVEDGGPMGAGDAFCRVEAIGGNGPGSRLAMDNVNQWLGNYTVAGVKVVQCDMKVLAGGALTIRPVMFGVEGTRYTATNAYANALPADGSWHHLNLFVTDVSMTNVNGGSETFAQVAENAGLFMIRHNSGNPQAGGTIVIGVWGCDNILATDHATFEPTSYQVTLGEELDGGLSALTYSDDVRLRIISDAATLMGAIEFTSKTPLVTPSRLTVRVEAYAARLGLQFTTALYRYTTNQYQVLDGTVGSTSDSVRQITLTSTAANYISSSTGEMKARVVWSPINDEAPAFDGWELGVDQIAWDVYP